MSAPAAGLVIAAPASGAGKTVVTLGLLRWFARSGIGVAGAKAGPDYIDPAFHAAASAKPCRNLDSWAMRAQTLAGALALYGGEAEFVICEGVMGLFDGAAGGGGATADLAALTGWPVVLVVDARGQGTSCAALVQGFARHRADVQVAGVVFNRVASAAHAAVLRTAVAHYVPEVAVLGCLRRDPGLALPSRHLGLVQAREHDGLEEFLERAAALVGEDIDTQRLRALARPARFPHGANAPAAPIPPLGQRIAVARDDAFAFAYEAVLEGWRLAGAELAFFSPLAGEAPAADADAVYLPGGYPELHAGRLSGSGALAGLRQAALRGAAIYGECGGYMALGETLEDAEGRTHRMAGLLPLSASFAPRRLHLGYREVTLAAPFPLGERGARFRGHEFHYAAILREEAEAPLFSARDAEGRALGTMGAVRGRVAGSFIHLVDRADAA